MHVIAYPYKDLLGPALWDKNTESCDTSFTTLGRCHKIGLSRSLSVLIALSQKPLVDNMCIHNSPLPGQNGRHFADDIFRCISMKETLCILVKISLKFVPKGPTDNNPALNQWWPSLVTAYMCVCRFWWACLTQLVILIVTTMTSRPPTYTCPQAVSSICIVTGRSQPNNNGRHVDHREVTAQK